MMQLAVRRPNPNRGGGGHRHIWKRLPKWWLPGMVPPRPQQGLTGVSRLQTQSGGSCCPRAMPSAVPGDQLGTGAPEAERNSPTKKEQQQIDHYLPGICKLPCWTDVSLPEDSLCAINEIGVYCLKDLHSPLNNIPTRIKNVCLHRCSLSLSLPFSFPISPSPTYTQTYSCFPTLMINKYW